MNHPLVLILLLSMPLQLVGQVRQPTHYKSAQREETTQERAKSPFEGRQIRSLEFRGNKHVPSATIQEFMNVKEGDTYSALNLGADIDRLRVLLFVRRGYLKARLDEPQIQDSPGGLDIVVVVQEGVVYRFGEIKVEDATLFSPDEVIQIVGLKSGEIANGYDIQVGVSKLSKLYRDRGYMQFNMGFIPDFKEPSREAEEGIVDVALELEEGEAFGRINRIQFEGNSKTSDQVLRGRLLIHDGDVYSESMLQESLSRLNSLGLFEELTLENVSLHTNGNSGLLDITIHLKETTRDRSVERH